jgi:two-component system response regulator (stage 0 sporulation protein F)
MSKRILLVEDEPGIQLALRGLLRRDGHQVFVESRGAEAMHAIETGSYDLILTDLSLEDGVSGLDIARCAREACPGTPVVLITAYGSEQIEDEARAAGVTDYVPKPFDNQIVRDVVRRSVATPC